MIGAIDFIFFYILAIANKKITAHHMRYIIVASLALLPPSIDRFFMAELKLGPGGGVFTPVIVMLTILSLIAYDKIKLKKISRPYIVALIFTLMIDISIPTFAPYHAWQTIALKIGQYL